jgi:hypothetical protein
MTGAEAIGPLQLLDEVGFVVLFVQEPEKLATKGLGILQTNGTAGLFQSAFGV